MRTNELKTPARPCTARAVWLVSFGLSVRTYYTRYHAEQMAYALSRNGTAVAYEPPRR